MSTSVTLSFDIEVNIHTKLLQTVQLGVFCEKVKAAANTVPQSHSHTARQRPSDFEFRSYVQAPSLQVLQQDFRARFLHLIAAG